MRKYRVGQYMVDEQRGVAEDTQTHQLLKLASKKTKEIMTAIIFGAVKTKTA